METKKYRKHVFLCVLHTCKQNPFSRLFCIIHITLCDRKCTRRYSQLNSMAVMSASHWIHVYASVYTCAFVSFTSRH